MELLERISKLRPIDDVMFEVLADDVAFCEEMLRTILEDKELVVKDVIVQSSKRNMYGRSVKLDALCVLGDGTRCNIEVQRADDDDHLRRARYNASMIVTKHTKPGKKFKSVPTVKVVYISEKDFFKGGKTIYHADMVLRETGQIIDDGYSFVMVNTEVNDGTDISDLMQCMMQTEVQNEKFPNLTNRMHHFKNTEGGRSTMCKIIEEYGEEQRLKGKTEGLAEGKAEGKAEGLAEGRAKALKEARESLVSKALDIVKNGAMSKEQVCKFLGLSLSDLQ